MSIHCNYCIDAGSEYCPCYLAEMGNCITCSRLQDKKYCDCNWRGVCIYQQYHFLNCHKKPLRDYNEVKIINKEEIGEKIIIFTLEVPKGLARQLKQPGSYIFIRNMNYEDFFDLPISIMDTDEYKNIIKIAVEIHGVKTKTIKNVNESLLIRGPYWNGLFGVEELKKVKENRCLFVIRGIAQAPAIPAIKYLLHNKNEIDVLLDCGVTGNIIKDYVDTNVIDEDMCLYSKEGKEKLNYHISTGNYKLLFLGGSDYLHEHLKEILANYKDLKMVYTNNKEICCGEGICGSCTVYDVNGIPIRSCKTQIIQKK